MSVDLSGEITAIATAVLASFAIVTAIVAYMAFRRQTQELAILQQQTKEQQEVLAREASDRRKAQAAQIFTGAPQATEQKPEIVPYAWNASALPVYDAQLWYPNWDSSPADPDNLGVILPGEKADGSSHDVFSNRETALSLEILSFRDSAGIGWIRMPDGALIEQSGPTVRDSVQAAIEPDLPLGYHRQDDQITGRPVGGRDNRATGRVMDAIVINPQSQGLLYLPRRYDIQIPPGPNYNPNRPPDWEIIIDSEDGSTQGVYTSPDPGYPVPGYPYPGYMEDSLVWQVWNRRDCRVFARIVLSESFASIFDRKNRGN